MKQRSGGITTGSELVLIGMVFSKKILEISIAVL